jgi:hypothetical protein
MTPSLLTLDDWARRQYGDASPCPNTLRAWARTGKIQPRPIKHGRAYFVKPDAAYTPYTATGRLVRRIHGASKNRA